VTGFFYDLKEAEYIIIGQGLSGTILSMMFTERQIPHRVIDEPTLSQSSQIAAGLINPIVLKRLKLAHRANEQLEFAKPFYTKWENTLGDKFFSDLPIHHIFSAVGEQNLWLEKSENPSFKKFLGEINAVDKRPIKSPHGIGIMKNTFWLKSALLIEKYRNFLVEKGCFERLTVNPNSLKDISSRKKVILANGHLMRELLPHSSLFFSPTRGEIMIVKANDLPNDRIFHSGVFILPLENNFYKVGATYHWDSLKDQPTEDGLLKLKKELEKFYKGSYEVVDHLAGVRPNTKDRKPLLGKINDNLYAFNGMGSRAALMAPWLANLMLDYLANDNALPLEYDISRFTSS